VEGREEEGRKGWREGREGRRTKRQGEGEISPPRAFIKVGAYGIIYIINNNNNVM